MIDWLPSGSLKSLRIVHATPIVIQVVSCRVFDVRVALRDRRRSSLSPGITSSSRFLLFCRPTFSGMHRAGEDDDVADRQDRHDVRDRPLLPVPPVGWWWRSAVAR